MQNKLRKDHTGMYKLVYFDESQACGRPIEGQSWLKYFHDDVDDPWDIAATSNAENFYQWFTDHKQFNKRVGFTMTLEASDNSTFVYDSKKEVDGRFHPLDQYIGTDKVWALTPNQEGLNGDGHKYWFTTEHHSFFTFKGGEILEFSGDDDFFVFLNNELVVDLGGLHTAYMSRVELNDENARKLGLTKGQIYSIDMFHAERHISESNFKLTTSIEKTCSVLWQGGDVHEDLLEDNLKLVGSILHQDQLHLTSTHKQDAVTYSWLERGANVGTGFISEFNFTLQEGSGEGFAFVIQRQGLEDFNGGTGGNLGFKNMQQAVAIAFDLCADRETSSSCELASVGLYYTLDGSPLSLDHRQLHSSFVVLPNQAHHVKIVYYSSPNWLEVYIDESLYLVQRDFDFDTIVGGRNAFFGFTAATSSRTSNIIVEDWSLKTVPLDLHKTQVVSLLNSQLQLTQEQEEYFDFTLQTFDKCSNPIEFGAYAGWLKGHMVLLDQSDRQLGEEANPPSLDLVHHGTNTQLKGIPITPFPTSFLERKTVLQEHHTMNRHLQTTSTILNVKNQTVIPGQVVDNNDGSYSLRFRTDIVGSFEVKYSFGPCLEEDASDCFHDGHKYVLSTLEVVPPMQEPVKPQIQSEWVFTESMAMYVGLSTAFFCVCGVLVILLLLRSRQKWLVEKKYVLPGKEAMLSASVIMDSNSVLTFTGTAVQKTKQQVDRLRSMDLHQDKQAEIARIEQETDGLRHSLKAIKRRTLERDAFERTSGRFDRPSSKKIQFLPQQVDTPQFDLSTDFAVSTMKKSRKRAQDPWEQAEETPKKKNNRFLYSTKSQDQASSGSKTRRGAIGYVRPGKDPKEGWFTSFLGGKRKEEENLHQPSFEEEVDQAPGSPSKKRRHKQTWLGAMFGNSQVSSRSDSSMHDASYSSSHKHGSFHVGDSYVAAPEEDTLSFETPHVRRRRRVEGSAKPDFFTPSYVQQEPSPPSSYLNPEDSFLSAIVSPKQSFLEEATPNQRENSDFTTPKPAFLGEIASPTFLDHIASPIAKVSKPPPPRTPQYTQTPASTSLQTNKPSSFVPPPPPLHLLNRTTHVPYPPSLSKRRYCDIRSTF